MGKVYSRMDISRRLNIPYYRITTLLEDHNIVPRLKLGYAGGRGISEEQFNALVKKLSGAD